MFEINPRIILNAIIYLLKDFAILNFRFTFYIFNLINKFINLRVLILGNCVYAGNNKLTIKKYGNVII